MVDESEFQGSITAVRPTLIIIVASIDFSACFVRSPHPLLLCNRPPTQSNAPLCSAWIPGVHTHWQATICRANHQLLISPAALTCALTYLLHPTDHHNIPRLHILHSTHFTTATCDLCLASPGLSHLIPLLDPTSYHSIHQWQRLLLQVRQN